MVLFVCGTPGKSTLATDGTPVWIQSQVATVSPGFSITTPDFAFNHHGTASIAWSAFQSTVGSNTVFRSELSGLGIWSHHTVTTGSGAGLQAALAFDRAEQPTVAWINADGSVQAQFNDGPIGTVAATATANVMQPALSLSYDLAGDLRGAFNGVAPGNLFDISEAAGIYASNSITTFPAVDSVIDLDLTTDNAGLGHIIARSVLPSSSQAVMIASQPSFGGNWSSAILTTADAINGVAITTDPTDGNVALAYTTFDTATNTSELKYAKSNGTSLITTTVLSSTTEVFQDLDLAFDFSDGRPTIAYERQVTATAAEHMMFAFLDAVQLWQTSLVDATISLEDPLGGLRGPSLAFDDFGTSFPAIAYVDSDESLVVSFDPPIPEPATFALLLIGAVLGMRPSRSWRGFLNYR
ncbi:MAG: hypothetical protein ACE5EC_09365 [Phycisphaerae bacterium]